MRFEVVGDATELLSADIDEDGTLVTVIVLLMVEVRVSVVSNVVVSILLFELYVLVTELFVI